ncbi:MAG: hypothetical protein ACRC2R_16905 [Xenococcaceae cyanobacterium]
MDKTLRKGKLVIEIEYEAFTDDIGFETIQSEIGECLKMQQIIKLSKARFYLCWDEKPQEQIIVNFNPTIEQFNLSGDFKLVHWQAKPKGLKQFGIYNNVTDTYTSTREQLIFTDKNIQLLQLDENVFNHIPTAVLLIKEQNKLKLKK